ncbi:MAG: orotidine-5'-phosphate decarboxylase, partial [candidate division WOR-3 bacterium]
FLDLKFHDIPNTVAGAAEACVRLRVEMLNVHISGGREMLERTMRQVCATAQELGQARPLVLGVTVLTSLDAQTWAETLGITERPVSEQVVHLARLAQASGLDGVVASPHEIQAVKAACGPEFLVLTPGIRLPDAPVLGDDQARTLTPAQAAVLGADFIVVGRPITRSRDPARTCAQIRRDIAIATTGEQLFQGQK